MEIGPINQELVLKEVDQSFLLWACLAKTADFHGKAGISCSSYHR
jgi:hypothetical protein